MEDCRPFTAVNLNLATPSTVTKTPSANSSIILTKPLSYDDLYKNKLSNL